MLKPIPLHILLALADGDSHGYAVMQAIREQTGGSLDVQTGSFYRHLGTLIDEGWVAEAPGRAKATIRGEARPTGHAAWPSGALPRRRLRPISSRG